MSEAIVIEAKGVPVTFVDGSTARVRFGLRAIKELEETYGSTGALVRELNLAMATDEDGQPSGKAFGLTWDLLRLGLAREGFSDDELEDLIDPALMPDYIAIVMDALAQGLGGKNTGPKGQTARKSRSPGARSTTSSPSLAIAATSSSGK